MSDRQWPALTVLNGDAEAVLRTIPDETAQCCVTSPPYWQLRDYGVEGQIGLEVSLEKFIDRLVAVFREVRRVLRKDGVAWVNMGDSYATNPPGSSNWNDGRKNREERMGGAGGHGLKNKDLIGQPWMLAFALRADGWFLRQDVIWAKPNPMPESIRDRCTKAHEYVFLLSKSDRYFWDKVGNQEKTTGGAHRRSALQHPAGWGKGDEPRSSKDLQVAGVHRKTRPAGVTPKSAPAGSGVKANESFHAAIHDLVEVRNRRSVWEVPSQPCPEAHFATFPEELVRRCVLPSTRPWDIVLDPFGGSGTTGKVALELGRRAILVELNPKYVEIIERRTQTTLGLPLATSAQEATR